MKRKNLKFRRCLSVLLIIFLFFSLLPLKGEVRAATTSTKASVGVSSRSSMNAMYPNQTTGISLSVIGKEGIIQIDDTSKVVPTDIVLVIDQSGSMAGTNMSALKPAARNFVDKIDFKYHRVAVVGYSSQVVTCESFSTTASDVKSTINGLVASGGTTVIPALQQAIQLFEQDGRKDAKKTVILLTDGIATDRAEAAGAAEAAKQAGVIFYTVGVYRNVSNTTTMNEIDRMLGDIATSKEHHHFIGAENINKILLETYEKIAGSIGKDKATNVTITQTISDEFEIVPGSTTNCVPRPTISGNTLTWNMLEALNGTFQLSYRIKPVNGISTGLHNYCKSGTIAYELSDGTKVTKSFGGQDILIKEPYPAKITSMTPKSGLVGTATVVTIKGQDFDYSQGFKVTVGGKRAVLKSQGKDQIQIYTPKDLSVGSYDVVVTNAGGLTTLAGQFTYMAQPTPTPVVITKISPTSGKEKVEKIVTVNFKGTMNYTGFGVKVGGVKATVKTQAKDFFSFYSPKSLSAGTYKIEMTSNGVTREIGSYTYNGTPTPSPVPIVTIAPNKGPEKKETIVTVKFKGTMNYTGFGVKVGGVKATVKTQAKDFFSFYSPKSLSAGTYKIEITSNGVTREIGSYTYNGTPTPSPVPIVTIAPNKGPEKKETIVTVKFKGTMDYTGFGVKVGGVKATVKTQAKDFFSFYSPKSLSAGTYKIEITSNGVTREIGNYTYNAVALPPAPVIKAVDSRVGTAKTENIVKFTVQGIDYNHTYSIEIGGKQAKIKNQCKDFFSIYTPKLAKGSYDIVFKYDGYTDQNLGTYEYR